MIIGTALTASSDAITSNNQLENDATVDAILGTGLLANCITGLGPNASDTNNVLGGWYFNGTRLTETCVDGVRVINNRYAPVRPMWCTHQLCRRCLHMCSTG